MQVLSEKDDQGANSNNLGRNAQTLFRWYHLPVCGQNLEVDMRTVWRYSKKHNSFV